MRSWCNVDGIAETAVMIDSRASVHDARCAENRSNVHDATGHDYAAGTNHCARTHPSAWVHDMCELGPACDQRGVPFGAHPAVADANDHTIGNG